MSEKVDINKTLWEMWSLTFYIQNLKQTKSPNLEDNLKKFNTLYDKLMANVDKNSVAYISANNMKAIVDWFYFNVSIWN